ncbi:Translation elongation factor [Parasponia andersonii]|uniref:Elongation factor Ts, mitochondrial n=1 Tax=Parasponia andersonii TaxID=3476 RepID=A0A2P5CML2_PARAD|nr:Translation elongation factor [Parasponia andersonii]
MTPVIPYSISNVSLIPGTVFRTRKTYCSTRFSFSKKSTINMSSSQKFLLPRSASFRLLPPYGRGSSLHNQSRIHLVAATETDVAVEEPDSPVAGEDAEASEVSSNAAEGKSNASPTPAQSKRSRPIKKSEMPPVKNEELVPGVTFTGKVRSIQPFGAFIDFGAFTDGLVHVSMLSDSYVKEVGSVVSVGQEVKVKLVEANMETGRISLSMREGDDTGKRKDASGSDDRTGSSRRNPSKSNQRKGEPRKVSKFVKGQDLEGMVKNMNRAGAFISLPEGEEGFLPIAEELDEGFGTLMGETTLQIGQEVSVRVLHISRGQVTLTMKKEEDVQKSDVQYTQGVIPTATNPFVLAFRKNKEISAFLDEREKIETVDEKLLTPKVSEELEKKVSESKTVSNSPEKLDQPVSSDQATANVPSAVDEIEIDEALSEKTEVEVSALEATSTDISESKEDLENDISSTGNSLDEVQTAEKMEVSSETLNTAVSLSTEEQVETNGKSDSPAESAEQILSSESSTSKEVTEQQADDAIVKDDLTLEPSTAEKELSSSVPAENEVEPDDKNDSITSSGLQLDDPSSQDTKDDQVSSLESPTIEGIADNKKDDVKIRTPAPESEILSASKVEDDNVGANSDKNVGVADSNGRSSIASPSENVTKATISPALVKQLREETGAGMMDCKKALSESIGDIVKAQEFLRKKGLASAEKKASRATAEGRIGSYIHDYRIGVLVEVNCETDFVSRGDIFKELVDDLAMQVAACPQVQYTVTEEVPEEIVNKEREIEMQKEDLLLKPEQIRSKIVDGRIKKRLDELALLEQPYIKNDKLVVKDWVKQTIATIGENMKVKRFVRFNLGEGLEKKSQDFAAEVAAQTAAKPAPKEQPAAVEATETVQKPPTVTISAALVKQLREETGVGMMDCKKALSETGGDIEKAQEYLRKKGLSSAEKKSSRLAAEGRIGSYIHDSRIGVLIEVNCETDFVGRSERFKELVDDLAMQVVASPQVQFVSVEDISESIVKKEKELELQREDLQSKPENIREKIVEGRVSKRLGELALLEQPFIKDDSILVKDLVKQTVATLGENIKVRRFVRFTLGETVENA